MSEQDFGPSGTEHSATPAPQPGEPEPNGSGSWRPWRRQAPDRPDGSSPSSVLPQGSAPEGPHADAGPADGMPEVLLTNGTSTHLHGKVDVVAGSIHKFVRQTRKLDLLEGVRIDRGEVLSRPFVCEGQWAEAWQQALAPQAPRPRERVVIVVAPRSFGATTFALRLLAEHTDSTTTLFKLDGDWNAPSQGRLPLEEEHAYQLDLKDPERDRPSADFLNALSTFASHLEDARSYLVLTVAQELWDDRLTTRRGVQVVYVSEPPDALRVVETRLTAAGHAPLVAELRSFPKAAASLRGLHAMAAVRAANTIVMTWQEHRRLQDTRTSAALPGLRRLTPISAWKTASQQLCRTGGIISTVSSARWPPLTTRPTAPSHWTTAACCWPWRCASRLPCRLWPAPHAPCTKPSPRKT